MPDLSLVHRSTAHPSLQASCMWLTADMAGEEEKALGLAVVSTAHRWDATLSGLNRTESYSFCFSYSFILFTSSPTNQMGLCPDVLQH